MLYSDSLKRLIDELKRLPGIGQKSAERLAFHILEISKEEGVRLARAISDVKDKIRTCSICRNITDIDPCSICKNPKRDETSLCIVERPSDVMLLEKTHVFKGRYFVLHGALSPIDGVGPEELKMNDLKDFVEKQEIKEVLVATNPTTEGEATAIYISRLLKSNGVKTTRLARGVPAGANLDFLDKSTLASAIQGRREI